MLSFLFLWQVQVQYVTEDWNLGSIGFRFVLLGAKMGEGSLSASMSLSELTLKELKELNNTILLFMHSYFDV